MKTVSDYLYSKASSMKIPLGGTFELSPVCNFACKMCYVRKTPQDIAREGKSLKTWQQWLELGRQCRDAGMLYLLLTGGEPFLYPNFRELYTALHEMGLIISINTNGTMIDEQTVAWLKEKAPQRVNITLYGASEDTYERICGQRSGYRRACRAIDLLRQAGIPVVINASMIPENQADLEEIIQFGKSRSLNTRVATYMFPPARREGEETDSRFTPQQCAQVFLRKAKAMQTPQDYARWLENQRAQHQTGEDTAQDWGEHREEFMRCRAGRSSFWVSWDGSMTACGIVPFPIVCYPFQEDFLPCWQRLTEKVRSTAVLSGCAGCRHKELCKPCVAMIQAETGSPNEKAPYLCQLTGCLLEQIDKQLEEIDHAKEE